MNPKILFASIIIILPAVVWYLVFIRKSGDRAGGYGEKVHFVKGQAIKFPDFEIEFIGERNELVPAFGRDIKYYDFRLLPSGETVSWTSGTGDIGPARFSANGKNFLLELRMSDKLGKLASDEMVIWPAQTPVQDK